MLIEPHIKIGDISFDDTKKQVRGKLNQEFEEGIKGFEDIKEHYDYFPNMEMFVFYDKVDVVNALEFFKPNPFFDNVDLLKMKYVDLVSFFIRLDPKLEIDYNGFTSKKYGIGGSTSDDPEDSNSTTESIIIFKRGYYD